jgi:hypothetical protein
MKFLMLRTVEMVRSVSVLRCKRLMLMDDAAFVLFAFGVGYLVVVVVASSCAMADVAVSCLVFFRTVLPLLLPSFSSLLFFSTLPVVVVVMLTDVFFLILVALCLFRTLILSLILLCRVDFFAFLVPSAAYLLPDFFVLDRRLVVVVDSRRTVLLVEVLVGLVVAADVLEAEVDLVVDRPADVVAPVVPEAVVDMVAEAVVVAGPWGCIP